MSNTPRGAPELALSQAVPETTVNEQIRRTEGGANYFTVADRVTAPPGTCANGAVYLIIATATGAFAGKEKQLAQAVGTNAASGWYYRTLGTLDEGVRAYVQDEDVIYQWSGSAWTALAAGGGDLLSTNNLSDVANAATSRTNLGLGTAATQSTGTFAQVANNLSDLANAGTARTNLGATTAGGSLLTLANPSAITFIRVNADNSVSALSASAFRTAIGAGTGSGSGDLVAANNLSDVASATTSRTNLGVGTGDSPQFTGINLGHASDTTLTRTGAGDIAVEGNALYRAGGTDVPLTDGGTGASTAAGARTNLGLVIGTDVPARSPSIQAVTSSATVTPTFADDQVNITAQAAALALANPTGTAVDGWGIAIRIKDNGTARAISYGTQYRAIGVTLPTTTVISKTLYLGMAFNNADTKWDVFAVAQEA